MENSTQPSVMGIPEPKEFTRTSSIKPATPDLLQIKQSDLPIDFMTDLLFEDIGGQEILSVSRSDLINGQNVIYRPIKNVSRVNTDNNSNNIFIMPESTNAFFDNFGIKFEDHTPEFGTGPNGEAVYIDTTTGDLVVNVTNMSQSDLVDIQVLSQGSSVGDIMYLTEES